MLRGLTFRHGVHPPELKQRTAGEAIRRLPFPDTVVLPLSQHTGKPAKAIVRVGDRVERGDLVAAADGWVSSPIHASASGTVADIGLWPHPNGTYANAIRIDVEPYSAQIPRPRLVPDWTALDRKGLIEAIRAAGVVGLGGAAFPTHVKLSPPADKPIDLIIVNGCECEPYLTTDHRTMAEYPDRVHLGIRILMKALGVSRAAIGVEKNKPDAIAALTRTRPPDLDIAIHPLTVKYPQGAEKMLIEAIARREVPSGGLPMDVGILVQNAASVATIAEVFETGMPLVERIVTVTGKGVRRPSNLIVPVGTTLGYLLDACGGMTDDAREIVFGGPMMGAALANMETPLLKGTTGVIVLAASECRPQHSYPCISCGHCLDACPVFLNPQHLGKLAAVERYDEMVANHLMDCMLCGCCSYVCPSHLPLSQQFAAAKTAWRQRPPAA
ncbi:MAG TPA: electron transport complex subunit RsxC [Gemmatimonadales bacterium]